MKTHKTKLVIALVCIMTACTQFAHSAEDATNSERTDLTNSTSCHEMCIKQTIRCETRDTLRTVDKAAQCKVIKDRCDAACSQIVEAEKKLQSTAS